MMKRTARTMLAVMAATSAAQASADCLSVDIEGEEYPAARERLIAAGWQPSLQTPAFEGAPFTDWVKVRNFAEVEACAGTGAAPCRFLFQSGTQDDAYLVVFTRGETIGVVSGHDCTDAPN